MEWGTVGADELSATLWRERKQLDFLLFLLETQLLHLRAGNWHRLNFTASELEKVVENLRFESLARGVETAAVAGAWNAPDQTTLPALIAVAPPGMWAELLDDHRLGMSGLLTRIIECADANLAMLEDGPPGGTTPAPEQSAGPAPAYESDDLALLTRDANVLRAATAVRSATLPTLREFLGVD